MKENSEKDKLAAQPEEEDRTQTESAAAAEAEDSGQAPALEEKPAERYEAEHRLEKRRSSRPMLTILAVLIIFAAGFAFAIHLGNGGEKILSSSSLEKIVKVAKLSTFSAYYNGVAEVYVENEKDEATDEEAADEQKEKKVAYYVAYEATVKLGINLNNVNIKTDTNNKCITVSMPKIEVESTDIDEESLDFIFKKRNANDTGIIKVAYQACVEDAKAEIANQETMFKIARENAADTVRALILPLVQNVDENYTIEFEWEA